MEQASPATGACCDRDARIRATTDAKCPLLSLLRCRNQRKRPAIFDKGLQITVEKPELPTLQIEQTTIKGGKRPFAANAGNRCRAAESRPTESSLIGHNFTCSCAHRSSARHIEHKYINASSQLIRQAFADRGLEFGRGRISVALRPSDGAFRPIPND